MANYLFAYFIDKSQYYLTILLGIFISGFLIIYHIFKGYSINICQLMPNNLFVFLKSNKAKEYFLIFLNNNIQGNKQTFCNLRQKVENQQMKIKIDGLKLAQEQEYQTDNNLNQRASNRSINSSFIDQAQKEKTLSTITEIPRKQNNISLASERIKYAYRKEKAGSSLTYRENKRSINLDNIPPIKSARNSPQQYKHYPHQDLDQFSTIQYNKKQNIQLNQNGINNYSQIFIEKSPLVSQRDKMKQKKLLSKDISEERLRSLSTKSINIKCCKQHHGSQNKYELEEERQKIQYILSVSGSIQNYDMYSNQEIYAENKIMSQYVRRFKRYVDFISQTNALQIDQDLEDIDAKLQLQREHLDFYSKQEEKFKQLYNRLQNPFYANNISVKADEIKKNITLIKKEIQNILSGRGNNKSPRESTILQKLTSLQKDVNLYGALLNDRKNKLNQLIEFENKLFVQLNPQNQKESYPLTQIAQQNQEEAIQQDLILDSKQIKNDKENKYFLSSSQENLKDVNKWNRSTNVTLDTDVETQLQFRRDTQAKSQKSNMSPNSNYILFSQESQPSQLFLDSITDDQEQFNSIHEKEPKYKQNQPFKKKLQKIIIQSPYLSHQVKQKHITNINNLSTRQTSQENKSSLIHLENQNKLKNEEAAPQMIRHQNFLNRRCSVANARDNSSNQKQNYLNISTLKRDNSQQKENKHENYLNDFEVNLPSLPINIDKRLRYKNQSKQQSINNSKHIIQIDDKKQANQMQNQLTEQLKQMKNQLNILKQDQFQQIQSQIIDLEKIKAQIKAQDEKCSYLDEMLQKQDKLILELN
ncbi:hypothetical protein TTHERM_00277230 (macronuclear) [Tetrahymena thermophila SB210]|uniref:Transmembrane protein n=1 Tax=Tetrahymena thermophila (strain SB210) TaxID=312017 RepID=I7LVC0_TETTS|nr:hypothetical protein TTHERM_00277230 [Tetrahymena thermophila SB210]EAR97838.2 hypothetical protein TTHERM_00277230 [Tetrahymena thermophila SB210]|eukprot:XP_001018083.2 hypothetical protein TTHERM_00277230 [Tetrahymena thermophila SB210]